VLPHRLRANPSCAFHNTSQETDMGLLDFLPNEWRGLLGSSIGRLPPQQPTAPLFVPPTEAAYGEPTSGDLWNTTPSPLGKFFGGVLEDLVSAPKRLYDASARDIARFGDHDFPKESAGPAFNTALTIMGGPPVGLVKANLAGRPAGRFAREATKEAGLEAAAIGQSIPMTKGTAPQPPLGYQEIRPPTENVHRQIGDQYSIKSVGQETFDTPAARTAANGSPAATVEEIADTPLGPMTELAWRYPKIAPPILKLDSTTGEYYWARQLSQEALDAQALRGSAQKEINKGNYTPEYNPAERFPASSDRNSSISDTRNIRMVRAATQQKYDAMARSDEARQRILEAYRRGELQKENAAYWSDVGQFEKDFLEEYGPDLGPRKFKEFAESMAATTPGTSPTDNLLLAHYGRYLKATSQEMPKAAHEIPYPVGGRYLMPNMNRFNKMVVEERGVTPATPKSYNYANDILGHYSPPDRLGIGGNRPPPEYRIDGPMIDERISRLIDPDMTVPPRGSYGHFQSALDDLAKELGLHPQYFRDLVWAGANPNHPTKPLIQIINEAIERTHRVTGMTRAAIRRGIVRANIPLYGIGGMLAAPQLLEDGDDKS
jgi:hypothetical protein